MTPPDAPDMEAEEAVCVPHAFGEAGDLSEEMDEEEEVLDHGHGLDAADHALGGAPAEADADVEEMLSHDLGFGGEPVASTPATLEYGTPPSEAETGALAAAADPGVVPLMAGEDAQSAEHAAAPMASPEGTPGPSTPEHRRPPHRKPAARHHAPRHRHGRSHGRHANGGGRRAARPGRETAVDTRISASDRERARWILRLVLAGLFLLCVVFGSYRLPWLMKRRLIWPWNELAELMPFLRPAGYGAPGTPVPPSPPPLVPREEPEPGIDTGGGEDAGRANPGDYIGEFRF